MDPFRLCLAFGPVAMYCLLLGCLNLSRQPFLVAGARDAAALALAVSGLAIIGPMELFYPFEAASRYGPSVWLLLLALYALCVALLLLLLRPRLVIYNITIDKLRPILADLVERLDGEARWAGDSLSLPGLGVHLYVDHFPGLRCMSLISAGSNQSQPGWRRLESALGSALVREQVRRNPRGLLLIAVGLALVAAIAASITQNPHAVAQTLSDIAQTLWKMAGI